MCWVHSWIGIFFNVDGRVHWCVNRRMNINVVVIIITIIIPMWRVEWGVNRWMNWSIIIIITSTVIASTFLASFVTRCISSFLANTAIIIITSSFLSY
jgi:hypothetical protein